ncbi:hypothetical protein BaRGS_00002240, partial [Batillaria attramentaria]
MSSLPTKIARLLRPRPVYKRTAPPLNLENQCFLCKRRTTIKRNLRNKDKMVKVGFCIITLSIHLFSTVSGHPQCLDFRPPFEAESPLSFCSNYTEFGCCTGEDDSNLYQEYLALRSTLTETDWNRCHGYIQDILCQKCSPYAAHIFDAERTMQARSFPGLCGGYCQEFFQRCGDVVQFLDPSFVGSTLLLHGYVFCQHVGLTDVDYCYPDLLTSPALNGRLQMQKETSEGCLCLEQVATNLSQALLARHSGDGTGRLFLVEQPGRIKILYPENKLLLQTPFLDIRQRRGFGDERGLLGLAFHPNFASNGRFFVYYTAHLGDDDAISEEEEEWGIDTLNNKVRISEMRVSTSDPNVADDSFEKIVLEINQPYANHNGGELMFLDDGHLYAFVGDGGAAGDPHNVAQNKFSDWTWIRTLTCRTQFQLTTLSCTRRAHGLRSSLLGSGISGAAEWTLVTDRQECWREDRGRVVCGDVGQNAWEELDVLKRGANYGWPAREGFECYDDDLCGNIGDEELPIHAYGHHIGKSVTGGQFYRGCESPALDGLYIYGDYQSGRLFSLEETSEGQWYNKELTFCGNDVCLNGLTNEFQKYVMSFGQDDDGEVYMLASASSRPRRADGTIFKIVDPLRRGNPADCPPAQRSGRVPVSHHRAQADRTS